MGDDPLEKIESAEDHRDRADQLVKEAEGEMRETLEQTISYEADIDISYSESTGRVIAQIHPQNLAEKLQANIEEDISVGVEPVTVYIGTATLDIDGDVRNIKELIHELQNGEGAPVSTVLDHATMVGLDRQRAEDEIEKLRRKGEVYEPRQDHVRTT